MLLLLPLPVAIGAALLRGGSLSHLATLRVRGSGLIVASFAIQLLLYLPTVRASDFVLQAAGPIYIGALMLALIGLSRNWHIGAGVRIALLGLALNLTAIALNGGRMPVNAAAMATVLGRDEVRAIADPHKYGNTQLAGPASRVLPLSDIIPVRLPGGSGNVYSIGDVILAAGVAALAYSATRRPSSRQGREVTP
jgi:uncharacterized protein DUF5317